MPSSKDPNSMLNLPPDEAYWGQVAAYVSPYAAAGAFLISGIEALNGQGTGDQLNAIQQKLNQISTQLANFEKILKTLVNETTLNGLTGAADGYRVALQNFFLSKSIGIIDNIISDSEGTSNIITQTINTRSTVDEYILAYSSLLSALVPIQISTFQCYGLSKAKDDDFMKSHLKVLISITDITIPAANRIGAKRVSALNSVPFSMEGKWKVGEVISFDVDGKPVAAGTAMGSPANQQKIYAAAVAQQAAAAAQAVSNTVSPFQEAFDNAQAELNHLIGP